MHSAFPVALARKHVANNSMTRLTLVGNAWHGMAWLQACLRWRWCADPEMASSFWFRCAAAAVRVVCCGCIIVCCNVAHVRQCIGLPILDVVAAGASGVLLIHSVVTAHPIHTRVAAAGNKQSGLLVAWRGRGPWGEPSSRCGCARVCSITVISTLPLSTGQPVGSRCGCMSLHIPACDVRLSIRSVSGCCVCGSVHPSTHPPYSVAIG